MSSLVFLKLLTILGCLFLVYGSQDKLVIVITGCSSGIGKSAAIAFAATDARYKVWATMRDVAKWNDGTSENLKIIDMDVTSEQSVIGSIDRIIEEDGHIDVIINNAGFGLAGTVEMSTIDEAKALFDVNVWGVVRVLQAVLPHMRKRRKGYVINISSTSGIRGIPCMEYYTGSKFALEGISDSMRYSLAPFNIAVTNLNAGPVRSGFMDRFGKQTVGGRGTRVVDDETGYLQALTDRLVSGLDRRMHSEEAQSSDEMVQLFINRGIDDSPLHAMQVLVNLVIIHEQSNSVDGVPFNVGNNRFSQQILEAVRVNPTGWGGIYNAILSGVPPLPPPADGTVQDEL